MFFFVTWDNLVISIHPSIIWSQSQLSPGQTHNKWTLGCQCLFSHNMHQFTSTLPFSVCSELKLKLSFFLSSCPWSEVMWLWLKQHVFCVDIFSNNSVCWICWRTWAFTQIATSGQTSVLSLFNLSSMDHNSKISCIAENIVGGKESSLLLDILCEFTVALPLNCFYITSCVFARPLNTSFSPPISVAPKITKLSDAIADHHWCIPFSVSGKSDPHTVTAFTDF